MVFAGSSLYLHVFIFAWCSLYLLGFLYICKICFIFAGYFLNLQGILGILDGGMGGCEDGRMVGWGDGRMGGWGAAPASAGCAACHVHVQ